MATKKTAGVGARNFYGKATLWSRLSFLFQKTKTGKAKKCVGGS
jgi:hypothetical protein